MAAVKGKLLALSWTMPPLVFPRSLQISRTLSTLEARGWETTVVTMVPEAIANSVLDKRLARLYAPSYRSVLVETREAESISPLWLRTWRRLNAPRDVHEDNWSRRAYRAMSRQIETGRYDAMITFAQPWIDHEIGLRIRRTYPDMPWIAHFSDPWVDSPYTQFADEAQRAQLARRESEIVGAADAVVFVNQYTADLVMAKYPQSWRRKVHLVTHGYDTNLLPLLPSTEAEAEKMRIVHAGNFYGPRSPDSLLQALQILVDEDPDLASVLQLELVGNVDQPVRELAETLGLTELISFVGRKGYLDSLALAQTADLLLLIDAPAETNVFLPSKIVDYFMLKRPILGLTPLSGASADALREAGHPVVDPTDVTAIAGALRSEISRWVAEGKQDLRVNSDSAETFDVRSTTEPFDRLLEQVTKKTDRAAGTNSPQAKQHLEDTFFPPEPTADGIGALLDSRTIRGGVSIILGEQDIDLAEILLKREDVESVLLPFTGHPPNVPTPSRYGWWNEQDSALRLPDILGREIHGFVPGGQWNFGLRAAVEAMRKGLGRTVFHDPLLGTRSHSIAGQIAFQAFKSAMHRLSQSPARHLIETLDQVISGRFLSAEIRQNLYLEPFIPGRIMLVSGSLGPGGSERQTVNTLIGLKASGVEDLTLLHERPLTPPDDFFLPMLNQSQIECLHLGHQSLGARRESAAAPNLRKIATILEIMGMNADVVMNYYKVFRKHRPEVVHTWLDAINVTAGLAAVMAGVPKVVVSCRSLAPDKFPFYQSYMLPIYRLLARQPNVTLLNNSAAGRSDYVRWAGIKHPIKVIRNGFEFGPPPSERDDIRERLVPSLAPDVPLVGTIMRLSSEKRPLLWLKAAELIAAARKDVHFVIIGDGPMMEQVKDYADRSPIAERIHLAGRRRDASELLSALDVFLLTSSVEGLPNVLIEAQANGVAVVATDVGGVREVLSHGETGMIASEASPETLSANVLATLADVDLQDRARHNAPLLMRQNFSIEKMVSETLNAYGYSE